MTDIGKRIKNRRIELGMSQDELAEKMGYRSRSTIAKIEKGVNDVVQGNIVKFAEVLQTSIAYLMSWDEEIEEKPVEMAERHFEIMMDEDINEIFEEFKSLDPSKKKIVKDLIHNLAKTEA